MSYLSLLVQWCFLGNEIYQPGRWLFYTLGMFNIHMHTPRTSSTLNVNSRLHAVVDWSVANVLKLVTLTRPVTNTRCAKNSNIDKTSDNTRAKNSSIDKTSDK